LSLERQYQSTSGDARADGQASAHSSFLSELFNREEQTLGGCGVGIARDLLDRSPNSHAIKSARARANDETAHIAGDTVAFLPSLKWTAGGALRAVILVDPHQGAGGNALAFGKSFLEGAALNAVGKLATANSAFARATAAHLGEGLLAESVTHLTVGFGMGAVKTGFNKDAWHDSAGKFSLAKGAENIVFTGGVASLVNVPAGMLGVRISKAATLSLGRGDISPATAALISGVGSGYASGSVFGGIEALSAGKSWQEVLSTMHKGGLVGAVTGGFAHGFESSRLQMIVNTRAVADDRLVLAAERPAVSRDLQREAREIEESAGKVWYDKSIDIVPRHLQPADRLAMSARLLPPKVVEATIEQVVDNVKGPFKDYADYQDRAMRDVRVRMREYEVEGHSTRIQVRETYAKALDEVRQIRNAIDSLSKSAKSPTQQAELKAMRGKLGDHPLAERALPEDFIPLLDELPDRSLMKKLVIVDHASADDAWMSQVYKPDFQAAASASPEGVVTFYAPNRHGSLREMLFHEWSHLVKFKLADESTLFDIAARLEKTGYFGSQYSRFSDHENFAVHMGEELLHWDADTFASMANSAPLRAAIFGRALVKTFHTAPPWARSIYHEQFNARLEYLNKHILPKAQEIVATQVDTGDLASRKLAVQLLGPLGNKSHLEVLKPIARQAADEELSELALDASLQIARRNGKELDLLMDVGTGGSAVRDTAIDLVRRLRDYRAPTYWRYLEAQGNPRKLPDLIKLVDQMPDAHGRQLAFNEALRLAGSTRDLQAAGSLMSSAPDRQSKEAAFQLILSQLSGKAQGRVRFAMRTLAHETDLREPALEVLAAAGDPLAETEVAKFTHDRNPTIAKLARRTLDVISGNETFDTLTAQMRAGSDDVRVAATHKLGESRELRAVKPLLEAVATGSERVRAEATLALRNYAPTVVKFELRELTRQRPELRARLSFVLQPPGSIM
jgi:HEAT repeat protein